MQNYDNLPGINVTVKDGGLIIPDAGGSESMLIVAPSLMKDAPVEPVLIRSSNELITYGFGDFYVSGEVNPIAAEWKVAVDTGCKAVYLVALKEISKKRASELEAAAKMKLESRGLTSLAAQSKVANVLTGDTEQARKNRLFVGFHDLLMGTLVDFSVDHIVVKGVTIQDEVEGMQPAFFPEVDEIENFPHIGGFIVSSYTLTSDTLSYPIKIESSKNDKIVLTTSKGDVEATLTEATYDGRALSFVDLAANIERALSEADTPITAKVRENNGVITIYASEPLTVKTEETTSKFGFEGAAIWEKTPFGTIIRGSFAQTIADYCLQKTLMEKSVVGYIGVDSPSDTKAATIRQHVANLMTIDTEISPYLQVVASETGIILPVSNQMYFTNGATHYAALVSTLAPESATTNKVVPGVKASRFNYSLRQLSQLTSKKIVTFRVKNGNQLVVTDGVTTAPSIKIANIVRDSDYARLSTLRITQLAITVVREACEPFIGEANQIPRYNSLNTAIRSALETIREAGAIMGYSFSVHANGGYLDQVTVSLEIIPAFELRRVNVEVNLAPPSDLLNSSVEGGNNLEDEFYRYM